MGRPQDLSARRHVGVLQRPDVGVDELHRFGERLDVDVGRPGRLVLPDVQDDDLGARRPAEVERDVDRSDAVIGGIDRDEDLREHRPSFRLQCPTALRPVRGPFDPARTIHRPRRARGSSPTGLGCA